MPAPEHLAPILDRIGDGGTVELAELVHQLMAEARADERGTAPAIETLQAQLDVARNELAHRDNLDAQVDGLAAVLIDEFGGPTAADVEHGACGTAVRILREQAADLSGMLAEIARLRIERTPPADSIHTLIERSSLGTPDAAAARASVPDDQAQAVVARAAELADTPDDDIDWDDDAGQPLQETVGDQLAATEGTPGPSNAEVRAWCLANDVPVNTKGAVRADARAAYDTAHQA